MNRRSDTRKQRYDKKLENATKYPISLCAINFRVDDNFGHLVRAAACFGAERIYVIGHLPERSVVKASSGSLIDYVEIVQFSSPYEFLACMEVEGIQIVAAELAEGAKSLSSYSFDFNRPVCLVVGNEEAGVPVDILQRSEVVKIDMPGVGYCLNTAQAANILLYEAVKQYNERVK